jgi:glycerol uptake facilitator-like aquaporin
VLFMSAAAVPAGRAVAAEGIGTALLLSAVVGSGIMGERLAGGNVALALLANTLATGAALVALILTFGPVSGAHLNPAVTAVEVWRRALPAPRAAGYIAAQIAGGIAGVALAHAMFEAPAFTWSAHARAGTAQGLSEAVATFGLVAVIMVTARRQPAFVPFGVGAWIVGAYWFTASTSFANPAVTIARSLTDTFAGIRAADVPLFLGGQAVGAALAAVLVPWLDPKE